ncbi:hypothetical protein ACWIGW_16355 [Nocardia brasiliensis]
MSNRNRGRGTDMLVGFGVCALIWGAWSAALLSGLPLWQQLLTAAAATLLALAGIYVYVQNTRGDR